MNTIPERYLRDTGGLLAYLLLSLPKEKSEEHLGTLRFADVLHIAQDKSGHWYGYDAVPRLFIDTWRSNEDFVWLGKTTLTPDWDTKVYKVRKL